MGNDLKASSPRLPVLALPPVRALPLTLQAAGRGQQQALLQRDVCVTPRGTWSQDSVTAEPWTGLHKDLTQFPALGGIFLLHLARD